MEMRAEMIRARTALWIAVASGLLAAPGPAGAAKRMTQAYGDWMNTEVVSSEGNPMCVAALIGADRQLMVKIFSNDDFVLHVFKEDWDIPEDLVVDVVLQVDTSPPMELVANGLGPPVKNGLEVFIHPEALWPHSNRPLESELVNLLSSGQRFRLSFPDGDEPPWEGSLRGSAKALNALADCRRRVRASRPTQPFGSKQGTSQALGRAPPQPFGTMPPALPQDVEEDLSEGPRRVPKPAKPPG
jgi:hypothetical protein